MVDAACPRHCILRICGHHSPGNARHAVDGLVSRPSEIRPLIRSTGAYVTLHCASAQQAAVLHTSMHWHAGLGFRLSDHASQNSFSYS